MEYQRQTINVQQRDMSETMLVSVVLGAVAYSIFYVFGAWLYIGISISELSHIAGFWAQWAAHALTINVSGTLLGAHHFSTWPQAVIKKADLLGDVVFYLSSGIGGWLGWITTAPAPSEIVLRGREVTRDQRKIQAELLREGADDGIRIHPALSLSKSRERQHFLVLGQTGAGKTQILLPLVANAIARGDRTLVFDYKGDLTSTTSNRIAIIAPWDERSWAWDIGTDVQNKQDARQLAAALIQDSHDPFWSNGARSLLVAMVVKLQVERGLGNWSWGDLAELVPAGLDKLHDMVGKYNPEGLAAVEEASKTTQSLRMTLASYLSAIFDLADAWDSTLPDKRVSIRRWMTNPPAHYPRNFIMQGNIAYAPLMQAYVQGILRTVQQTVGDPSFTTGDHKIWLFLDEFIQLGKLDTLLPLLEVARGKGIRVVLAAQDFARISEVYGNDAARALMGTVATKIFGMTSGTSSQDYSDLIGDVELKIYNVTHSSSRLSTGGTATSGNQSVSWQTEKRPCFAPSQFGTDLGQRQTGSQWYSRALLFTGGKHVGVLDWPRTIWPEQRPASQPAEWLTPGWPHRKEAFLMTATDAPEGDDGRTSLGASAAGTAHALAEQRPVKPAAAPLRVAERLLPTDKAPDENPLQAGMKIIGEHETETELDADDAISPESMGLEHLLGDTVHAIEVLDKLLEAADGITAQAEPGQLQTAHVATRDDEEEEAKREKRKRDQQQRIAEDAARQMDEMEIDR